MKIKSVILFIVMAFAFSYLAQISVRAFWIQKNGHLMWFDGQVLGSSDPVVYTYIIRPKPTALPTTIPTATPTPTPAPQSFFDMAADMIFGTSSSSSSAPAGGSPLAPQSVSSSTSAPVALASMQGQGHNKSSSSSSSGYYYSSSSSSYHPYSSSSSSRQSSSAVPLCGGITCLATQTCYQNICWEKCVGGTCLGQYECVSGACIPKSGGGYSSYGLALTATPKPTAPPNILYTSSSSSSKSSIISTPIIPPRLTNTPAPTYTPKIGTKYTPGNYTPPALPTPTSIPQNLQGDTSTIIVRQPDHDDVYTNKMVDKIDIAAPVAAAEHVSSAGKKTGNQSSSLAQTENNDQTTTPDNALDITLSLKQKKDANLALRQDQLVIERGKQVVTVAAATNQNGTLTLTQNDVMATLTMSLSIDPATNFLTVNTPNGPMRVSIMPDDAVAIIKQLQVADANKIPSNIVLESRNNQLEYKISATKLQKLLWFMPISIPQEVYVSADTGGLIAVERSAFYNFISLFTF